MNSIPVYNACCMDLISFLVVFFVIKIFNQKIFVLIFYYERKRFNFLNMNKMCFKKAIENILCHQICKDMSMENQAKGGTYMNFML